MFPTPVPIVFYDPPSWAWSSCVDTAKFMLRGNVGERWGNAQDIIPDDRLGPQVGLIIITNEGNGHIGVVVSMNDKTITIKEGNYIHGQLTTRTLSVDDPVIKGYKKY